ncbi:MAG: HAMP domain-containing histidine kinase [Candidatus Thermoplasmatota archaeon]|nr:HAMP domain-containing histidine kinase [Candidatus Thermoplasmatota archaeon]
MYCASDTMGECENVSTTDIHQLREACKKKDEELEALKKQLAETEEKLNELNHDLEQKVIERTVEVNRLLLHKTKFIDNLSHDLGTPLTPMMALLPVIRDAVEDPEIKGLVDTCIRNAEYIKRVVHDTQEMAELSAIELYLKKENLFSIVDELVQKYTSVFSSFGVIVENNISKEVFVNTEKTRLLEVIDHLSSNAVNSMPDGGTLTFSCRTFKQKTGLFIELLVKDSGVGMSREKTDHLFDEFYKADESRHKLDSTGLGLTICKRIVEKHGGRIWADSRGEGTGTTIHLTIPVAEV